MTRPSHATPGRFGRGAQHAGGQGYAVGPGHAGWQGDAVAPRRDGSDGLQQAGAWYALDEGDLGLEQTGRKKKRHHRTLVACLVLAVACLLIFVPQTRASIGRLLDMGLWWTALQAPAHDGLAHDAVALATRSEGVDVGAPRGDATAQRPGNYGEFATARLRLVPVYDKPDLPRRIIGRVRSGQVIAARPLQGTHSCQDLGRVGQWYQTPLGSVCSSAHFLVSDERPAAAPQVRQPDMTRTAPFAYARVTQEGALRYGRLPTPSERERARAAAAAAKGLPSYVAERMVGDYFMALEHGAPRDAALTRTVSGEYVATEHLKWVQPSSFVGEALGGAVDLPLAFVFGDGAVKLYCQDAVAGLFVCGEAEKHARFKTSGEVTVGGEVFVRVLPAGELIRRSRTRIATGAQVPDGVPDDAKWVHIELTEQTLVAYEGEKPVYATLVSTGKQGHETPIGKFRTARKFVSTRMRGVDPVDGVYHVEEVPWVMFYHRGYALHAAYWHNDFGNTRSHGCTNLSPADARWLFYWDTTQVPRGIYEVGSERGAWLHFSRDEKTVALSF